LQARPLGLYLPGSRGSCLLPPAQQPGVLGRAANERRERQPALEELHVELWHLANVSTGTERVDTTMVLFVGVSIGACSRRSCTDKTIALARGDLG